MKARISLLPLLLLAGLGCNAPEQTGPRGKSEATQRHYLSKTEQHALLPVDSTAVMFAGDSHVEYGHWSEWLHRPVLNRGISGDDLAGLQARLAHLDPPPQHLILLIGYNDVLYGRAATDILAAYTALLDTLQHRYPQMRRSVVNLPPLAGGNAEDQKRNGVVRAVNAGLAQLAETHGLTHIDLYSAVAVADALDPALTHDGLHLNGAGYARLAALLRPIIGT